MRNDTTMRQSLQALMKKIKGKTVFIIGGGPSARHVDFQDLQDELVICINDAYLDFPNATAIYWMDDVWAAENLDGLTNHRCDLIFTSKKSHNVNYIKTDDPKTTAGSFVLKRTGFYGFDPNVDCVMGNNSGVQALNLTINIFLYSFYW